MSVNGPPPCCLVFRANAPGRLVALLAPPRDPNDRGVAPPTRAPLHIVSREKAKEEERRRRKDRGEASTQVALVTSQIPSGVGAEDSAVAFDQFFSASSLLSLQRPEPKRMRARGGQGRRRKGMGKNWYRIGAVSRHANATLRGAGSQYIT